MIDVQSVSTGTLKQSAILAYVRLVRAFNRRDAAAMDREEKNLQRLETMIDGPIKYPKTKIK